MSKEVNILLTESDEGHHSLIRQNLGKAGITNPITLFKNGREILDYLFENKRGTGTESDKSYLLMMDIRMPEVNGTEVLRRIKADEELKKMPVIILIDSEDPEEMEKYRCLGCGNFVTKPFAGDTLVKVIKKLGFFLMIVEVPTLKIGPGII